MAIAPVDGMDVRHIMTAEPRTCTPDTTLAEAARLMWEADCGVLPVVDEGELVGIVTDRDMYIALATQNERAAVLRVGAVATTEVVTCRPDDDVQHALATMRRARVRRLPVVGERNTLLGILSLSDIVRLLDRGASVEADEVVETLKAICAHPNVGTETERLTEKLHERAHGTSPRHRAKPIASRGAQSTTRRTGNAQGRPS